MTDHKEISKLISYWLRHNPKDASLTIDEYGWVTIAGLIDALKFKGYTISLKQLKELNQSFDKVRWEFNALNTFIRATHGHSITVLLDDKISEPPPVLYHGTSTAAMPAIMKTGLISMQRQFVHLSAEVSVAYETAKRHGKPMIVEIDTDELLKQGWSFYKTSENVWLTQDIGIEYLSFEPWYLVYGDDAKKFLLQELREEVGNGHVLYYQLHQLDPIMRRGDCDNVLYADTKNGKIYCVHLTYAIESNSKFPATIEYLSFNDWLTNGLTVDQNEWYML